REAPEGNRPGTRLRVGRSQSGSVCAQEELILLRNKKGDPEVAFFIWSWPASLTLSGGSLAAWLQAACALVTILRAWASDSSVRSTPPSMRAISSTRPLSSSLLTAV